MLLKLLSNKNEILLKALTNKEMLLKVLSNKKEVVTNEKNVAGGI